MKKDRSEDRSFNQKNKQNAMTKLKRQSMKSEIQETFFFQVKHEFMDLEKSFLVNRFKKVFPNLDNHSEMLDRQSLNDLLTFLKKQTDLQQTGEMINTILIARIKSLIIKN